MATAITETVKTLTTNTEYTTDSGWFKILPSATNTTGYEMQVKAQAADGFTSYGNATVPNHVHIDRQDIFKFIFTTGTITLERISGYN